MNTKQQALLAFYNTILTVTHVEKSSKQVHENIPVKAYTTIDQTCRKLFKAGLLSRREQPNPNGHKNTIFYTAKVTEIYELEEVTPKCEVPKYMMDKMADKYIETSRLARLERRSPRVYVSGAQTYASF